MTDRGLPGVDGPPACPFIAFEDERDERSSSPDHRHRCFAEVEPAPRALAHQEAYCLSSAFPVCPTFQDWARREAAQARSSGRPVAAPPAGAAAVDASDADDPANESDDDREDPPADAPSDDEGDDLWSQPVVDPDEPAQRNPPRDWAAPPPWATGGAAGTASTGPSGGPGASGSPSSASSGSGGSTATSGSRSAGSGTDRPPEFLASRSASAGLAGSAADRLASGQPGALPPASPPSDDLAALVAPAAAPRATAHQAPISRPPTGSYPTTTASGRRPTVSSTRPRGRGPSDHDGPSWEDPRRYEAYPTIKARRSLPGIPRIAMWGAALGIAALVLFFVPDLLHLGGSGGGATAPTSSAQSTDLATLEPTDAPVVEPTGLTYTIKKGDILNKIAKKYGITLEQLLAANKATIKNPNKITVGQVIVIPEATPKATRSSAAPSASSKETPAP
jgi:LysM repeat protein